MDDRIKRLNKEQRIALARLVSDLIMADKIIEKEEIEKFEALFGEDDNRELFLKAQQLTFAQAVKILREPFDVSLKGKNKANAVMRKINSETTDFVTNAISNSDGSCAPSEAILLLAIKYFLKENTIDYSRYDIQSFKLNDLFIGKNYVLYADSGSCSERLFIEDNYDIITSMLASINFQFMYIPKMVERFIGSEEDGEKNKNEFRKMAMYLFPDIAGSQLDTIFENISNMTTDKFVSDYLNEKLGFNISCPSPSFYVMLGRSSVLGDKISECGLGYDAYANFLKICIEGRNILHVISNLVSHYNNIVSYKFSLDTDPSNKKLLYTGMFKAFFRIVALAKDNPNHYTVNINTSLGSVFINDRKLILSKGKTAIYILILLRSLTGDCKGLPKKKCYCKLKQAEKDDIQRQYESIYSMLNECKHCDIKPLYPNVVNRFGEIQKAVTYATTSLIRAYLCLSNQEWVTSKVSLEHITINGAPITKHRLFDIFK